MASPEEMSVGATAGQPPQQPAAQRVAEEVERQEPSPEDYKGWREVVEESTAALKNLQWARGSFRREYIAPGMGGMEVYPWVSELSAEEQHPAQVEALELQGEVSGLQTEIEARQSSFTAWRKEMVQRFPDAVRKYGDGEEYVDDNRLTDEERDEYEALRVKKFEALDAEFPQTADYSRRTEEFFRGIEEREDTLEGKIISARKQQEQAEWRALYGDRPMEHPLDFIRRLPEDKNFKRYFTEGGQAERIEAIQRIERTYYLKGPAAAFAMLADQERTIRDLGLFPNINGVSDPWN
ncbi:hypothetical protein L0Y40_03075 [Candidatus Wolfebacteria bacterium]|nr:hypothetical protein [Candidatus Wolfebacteria bacterium]